MIVVAADNGRPFPRCKSRLYDSGIKTPWVVHFPSVIGKPSISQSLVSVIDLSATCLELAKVDRPDCIQGRTVTTVAKCALDARQGGAKYVDQEVVIDGNIVTARTWHDNTALLREFIKMLSGR